MGESTNPRATLRFDRRIRLEFRGATITSDAGLLACRELDDALGLTETASECLQESRGGRNVQHRLVGLLRQSVYSRLAGYEDTNDAERLADDPSAGNVHSAHKWRQVLDPILSRYGETGLRRYFRADAAFAKPDIYEYLEERRVFYAIRLPSNKVLQYEIAPLLIRPVGRPPKRSVILYDDFWYRAESWGRARRVVAKVEWHRGELFPRVGFIVTNMTAGPEGVVRFYNGRGTAEQWIKEGKYALNWTRLSCRRFVANRVRLSLFVLAYNLGNFLRRLCLPKAVKHWSLRSVQVKLIKMGGRLVRRSRRLIFQLSEVSVPRRLFQGVLDRIGRLSPAPS